MIQSMPVEAYQLGTATAEYRPKTRRLIVNKILGAVLAAAGVLLVFVDMLQRHPSGMFVLGGVLLALGLWVFWTSVRDAGLRVLVFADGLSYTARGKTEICRWDDITEVVQQVTKHYTNGIYTGTTHIYTVRRTGAPELKLNDALDNVEQLGNEVQQQAYRRLMPRAIETFRSGGVVQFGKLKVSQQGLSNGKETLPWSEVKGVKLEGGVVSVAKQGKWLNWASATVAQTPNIFVFAGLVDAIVGINNK
jgi:hypothetical protein